MKRTLITRFLSDFFAVLDLLNIRAEYNDSALKFLVTFVYNAVF